MPLILFSRSLSPQLDAEPQWDCEDTVSVPGDQSRRDTTDVGGHEGLQAIT